MSAETELYAALSGAAGVTALVSTRIYPDMLPEKTTYPAIVFGRGGTDPVYSVGGAYFGATVRLQVAAWGETRTKADAVGAAIEAAVRAAGIGHTEKQGGYDPETDLFATTLDVEIFEAP